MAQVQSIEGTWDELLQHAAEFQGKKLRLTVVADEQPEPQNLADFLGDFIGCIDGSEENFSEDTGEKFSAYLVEKHKDHRL